MDYERRQFLGLGVSGCFAGIALGALPYFGCNTLQVKKNENQLGVVEVSPVEDLMREHGALNRVLLIYQEVIRRIDEKEDYKPKLLKTSAQLIQSFIENYHEKLEEEYIFPRLKKAGKLVELIDTLTTQHQAGRRLTARVIALSSPSHVKNDADLFKIKEALSLFIRMYRPHEAREDTILFPEFKTLITPKEYDELGDKFEDKEHELFGKEGFEAVIDQIAGIEKDLGIYDLAQFTPKQI